MKTSYRHLILSVLLAGTTWAMAAELPGRDEYAYGFPLVTEGESEFFAVDIPLDVYHSVQYLEKLITEGKITLGGDLGKKVTYHDPCDLGRTFQIFEEPRDILKNIPGLEYVEMARNRLQARCCGGGGGLQANDPDMAVDIATERVRDALSVGAEIIVSGCAACKDNLRKGARAIPKQERGKIKVMDITEMVAKCIEK